MKEYKIIYGGIANITDELNDATKELWKPILQCSYGHSSIVITLEREVPNPTPYR